MMNQYLLAMKKSKDKKHRIFEVIQSIKDSILKRKYNQAWDYAAKYYEQNKNSLINDQIYQLCWLSCESINKKTKTRLMASPKSYLPTLTSTHLQHLYSLYLSLHLLLFPQVCSKSPQYFNMLGVTETLINPKSVSPFELVFQRKQGQFFMKGEQTNKQLKKLVKLHLKIANNTLMFKVKSRKCIEDAIEAINNVQQIFESFEEYEFPVESMTFQLIKLSIMEDLKIKQGIKCEYRLPIGLINKIYSHLKGNKEEAVNHYVRKLTSYMVLSFRNLFISIQDMYIICQQMIFLTKVIHQKATPSQNFGLKIKPKNVKLNRQITIQGPFEQNGMNRSIKSNFSNGFSTSNKLSEKKLQSKTKLSKPQGLLKSVAMSALQKINKYLQGQKQIKHIILAYFPTSFFDNINNDPSDEIIQNQIALERNTKNKKQQENHQQIYTKSKVQDHKSLADLLKQKGMQKKVSTFDEKQEKQTILSQNGNKKQGKFITRNIKNLKQQIKHDENINKKLMKIVSNTPQVHKIQIIDQSSSDQEANLQHSFQRQRKQEIHNINKKHCFKICNQPNPTKIKQLGQQNVIEQNSSHNYKGQQRARSISLLDDVVNIQINNILQLNFNNLPQCNIQTNKPQQKLANLKMQAENLNMQRALLVERLTSRSNKIQLNDSYDSYMDTDKGHYQINGNNFTEKINQYRENNKLKIYKDSKSQINNQPRIKLKLDKEGRKLPQLTFTQLQQQYRKMVGLCTDKKAGEDMFLSCHYDKLRRDVSKNQFASQNQNKGNKKPKCKTILEKTHEDQIIND